MTDSATDPAYRYVVIRAAADLPDGFLPPDIEGRWYDLDELPPASPQGDNDAAMVLGEGVAVATDRFERRDDGATARVYEVRP